MARILKVVGVLALCVALSQPSTAFPLYGCGCDCYEDCAECGYVRYPDEPMLPLHVIQPNCYKCQQSLPYQIQMPLPPPTAPCGQQFGVRVEVPHTQMPCKPCLNIGYEVETPLSAPCLPKLPNLPVSVTVPMPKLNCHQPCNFGYEIEAPVAPCSPLLTNLKTQVDRVVLPCPCAPPVVEGYVPKAEPARCKRCAGCGDPQCDCGCMDEDDDEEEDDDCEEECERPFIRRRRSPSNWRPSSNQRMDLFPASRTDTWRRPKLVDNRVGPGYLDELMEDYDDGDVGDMDDESDYPSATSSGAGGEQSSDQRRIVTPDTDDQGGQSRIENDGGGQGDQERIVSRNGGQRRGQNGGRNGENGQNRIVSRNGARSGGQNGDQRNQDRIVSRNGGENSRQHRIASRKGVMNNQQRTSSQNGNQADEERISRDREPQEYDYRDQNWILSSDPVDKRWQDPEFLRLLDTYYDSPIDAMDPMDRELLNSVLGTGGDSQNIPPGSPIEGVLGALRDEPGGRTQGMRSSGPQQNSRSQGNSMPPPPNRMRLNGASGQSANPSRQSGSQDRITTPSTYRTGEQAIDPQGQNGEQSPNGAMMQRAAPPQNGPQRQRGPQSSIDMAQGQAGPQAPRGSQMQNGPQGQNSPPRQRGSQNQNRAMAPTAPSGQSGPQRPSSPPTGNPQRPGGPPNTPQTPSGPQSGAQQRGGPPPRTNGSTGSQMPLTSSGSVMRTGRPGQPQRSPGQRPPNPRRGSAPCNICDRRMRPMDSPNNLAATGPDDAAYMDYPMYGRPPISAPPGRRTSALQRQSNNSPQQTNTPQSQVSSQNSNSSSQPSQPPSPADTSRIVTPSTYDEQPNYFDYNYSY